MEVCNTRSSATVYVAVAAGGDCRRSFLGLAWKFSVDRQFCVSILVCHSRTCNFYLSVYSCMDAYIHQVLVRMENDGASFN